MKRPAGTVALLLTITVSAGCTHEPPQVTPPVTQTVTPSEAPTPLPAAPIAAPPVTPTPTTWPQTLTIPKLSVNDAQIVGHCETLPDGRIEPPADIHATCITGREDLDPAGLGVTSLTGHTTRAASTGALEQIGQLAPGDTVTTGAVAWRVTQVGTWPATALPPELFAADARRLILTTCHLTPAVLAGAPYTDTDVVVGQPIG